MKTTTSTTKKISSNAFVAITATGYLGLVLVIAYISYFAA